METKGFPQKIREFLDFILGEHAPAEWDDIKKYAARIPDGFIFDFDNHELIIFEVEYSHKMDLGKFNDYIFLWVDIDALSAFKMRLIVVDQYGNEKEVDVVEHYYAHLLEGAEDDLKKIADEKGIPIEEAEILRDKGIIEFCGTRYLKRAHGGQGFLRRFQKVLERYPQLEKHE